jgi:hypothetical protein
MTMFSSCPGNMWSARSSAPVHQIHNQPAEGGDVVPALQSARLRDLPERRGAGCEQVEAKLEIRLAAL